MPLRWCKLAFTVAVVSSRILQHPSLLSQTWGTVFHITPYKLCLTLSAFLQDQLFRHLQKQVQPCPAGAQWRLEKSRWAECMPGPYTFLSLLSCLLIQTQRYHFFSLWAVPLKHPVSSFSPGLWGLSVPAVLQGSNAGVQHWAAAWWSHFWFCPCCALLLFQKKPFIYLGNFYFNTIDRVCKSTSGSRAHPFVTLPLELLQPQHPDPALAALLLLSVPPLGGPWTPTWGTSTTRFSTWAAPSSHSWAAQVALSLCCQCQLL